MSVPKKKPAYLLPSSYQGGTTTTTGGVTPARYTDYLKSGAWLGAYNPYAPPRDPRVLLSRTRTPATYSSTYAPPGLPSFDFGGSGVRDPDKDKWSALYVGLRRNLLCWRC